VIVYVSIHREKYQEIFGAKSIFDLDSVGFIFDVEIEEGRTIGFMLETFLASALCEPFDDGSIISRFWVCIEFFETALCYGG
jgi:hypothetical protein